MIFSNLDSNVNDHCTRALLQSFFTQRSDKTSLLIILSDAAMLFHFTRSLSGQRLLPKTTAVARID